MVAFHHTFFCRQLFKRNSKDAAVLIVNKKAVNLFLDAGNFLNQTVKMVKTAAWVASIQIVLQITSAVFKAIVSPLFLVDIRERLYTSLMYADITYFDNVSSGVMIGRISEGVSYIRDVYVEQLLWLSEDSLLQCAGDGNTHSNSYVSQLF